MGNQACCAVKDSEADKRADRELSMAEAVPVMDGPAEKKEAPIYEAQLDKTMGGKLGLDVDYMPQRRVLPVMCITGGLAEQWNQGNPDKQISKGDSVISVNDVKGDVAAMLERCKQEPVVKLVLKRKFNYDHLVAEIDNLITAQGCGASIIRLAWHDVAMRFASGGENKIPADAGLPTVALNLMRQISAKYVPDLISNADLWALAANVAIRIMSGPNLPTRFGRVDAKSSVEIFSGQEGKMPDGDKGMDHLRVVFHAKGFDDKGIVALAPALLGSWTEQPLKFDNSYFKELVARAGAAQKSSGNIMATSDKALLEDSNFKFHAEAYANDQTLWFTDFGAAWQKLMESGLEGLRDVL